MTTTPQPTVRIFGAGEDPAAPGAAEAPAPPPPAAPPPRSPGLGHVPVLVDPDKKSPASPLDEGDAIERLEFPQWPDGLVPPRKGKAVYGIKIRAAFTDNPNGADRHIILWTLSVGDEKAADNRAMLQGNPDLASLPERTKQMIRAVDGRPTDWRDPASVDALWDDMGPKYRNMLKAFYTRFHAFDDVERMDFFGRCFAHRVVG